jgi:hypothetical protein
MFTVYHNLVEVGFEPNSSKPYAQKTGIGCQKIFNVSMKEERWGGNGTFPLELLNLLYMIIGCTY